MVSETASNDINVMFVDDIFQVEIALKSIL